MTRGEMRTLLRHRIGDPTGQQWAENLHLDLELDAAAIFVGNEVAVHQRRNINYARVERRFTGDGTTAEFVIATAIVRATSGTTGPANFIREFLCEQIDGDNRLPLTRIEEDEAAAWLGTSGAGTEPTVYYIAHRPSDFSSGSDTYVIGFPEAPSTSFVFRLQWTGYPLGIASGNAQDDLTYNFIPNAHHELVILRAAKSLLHAGDERYPSVTADYGEGMRQLYEALNTSVHAQWVEQSAYPGEPTESLDATLLTLRHERRDY